MSNQWKWKTPEFRFWEKVNKSPGLGTQGKCWEWVGGRRGSRVSAQSSTFYGGFRFQDKVWLAHRLAYKLVFGYLPKDMSVLHRCDNPACVNPDHLFLGEQSDNMKDCVKKGRHRDPGKSRHQRVHGEAHGLSKLKNSQVLKIRELSNMGIHPTRIARQFKITRTNVNQIVLRKTWKHLKDVVPSQMKEAISCESTIS